MCVVSMVGDFYGDKWRPYFPPQQGTSPQDWENIFNPPVKKSDLDALRKEVEDMKELLKRALEYDRKNNEHDCEIEEKMAVLKAVAKAMGVNLDDVLKKKE